MMMADAMIQIHAQHIKMNKYNNNISDGGTSSFNNSIKSRTSLPKIPTTFMGEQQRKSGFKRGHSFIVGQKLRESKWFKHHEEKILCAVVESGFIIEKYEKGHDNTYGVVMWVPGYEKSKDPFYLTIYTLIGPIDKLKVQALNLNEFWKENTEIRINNKSDKTDTPNKDEDVRRQIKFAEKRKFHNSEHFAYFCRYEKPNLQRTRKITDMKWSATNFLAKFRAFTIK